MNSLNPTERSIIKEDWGISLIEKHLAELLPHCEMWGNLNISEAEYRNIMNKIAGTLDRLSGSGLKELFRGYPVVMVTDMIFYSLYKYENDFWNGWTSRFNISIGVNHHAEIGRMVQEIFKNYHFDVIEDGGYAYVTPILCQAGIPNTCFDKIFDILDSTLGSTYFNPQEIVNELMGYRSYLIDAPVMRYFRLHTDRAVDLIFLLREMMQALGNVDVAHDATATTYCLEQRIINRYMQWRDEEKTSGRKSKKEGRYYFPPKLVFDSMKGICLFIPEQTLRQDSIYKLQWRIILDNDDERTKTHYAQVYNVNGRNFTRETSIPVGYAGKYVVELKDADHDEAVLISPWVIGGLERESNVLAFNNSGSMLLASQRYIARKGTTVVFDGSWVTVANQKNINTMHVDLPAAWAGFKAVCVYPSEKDAWLTLKTTEGVISFETKHSFDVELMQRGTLFDEKYNDNETPVYTRFPIIAVSGNMENHNKAFFHNWQVILIHRVSNTKHTLNLSEMELNLSADTLRIFLDSHAIKLFEGMYGAYELRLYDGSNRKYFIFYLANHLEYQVQIEDIESDRNMTTRRAVFYVRLNDDVQLEFNNDRDINVLPAPAKGSSWYEISTTSKPAYINGYLTYELDGRAHKIPFKKTIRKLHWAFWNEHENETIDVGKTKQFDIEELKELNWRLIVHFTGEAEQFDTVKLVLEEARSKQLQSKDIKIDLKGNFIVSLNMFLDTIDAHLLPQRLMLYITKGFDDYLPICIAVIKSHVNLIKPKYALSKGRPLVYWLKSQNEIVHKRLEITSLNDYCAEPIKYPLNQTKTFKDKAGNEYEFVFLDTPLNNGIYYIEAVEDSDFFFFDDEEQVIHIYDQERVFCVNGQEFLNQIMIDKSNQVSDWLSAITIALYNEKWIEVMDKRLRIQIEKGEMVFDSKACASLLFSLLIYCGEKSNLSVEIKSRAREVCLRINDFVVTNVDRTELLKLLLESSFSENDCLSIINDLQLYLFCSDGTVKFEKTLIQRIWDINEKIAILLNLRGCVTNPSADVDRIISKIGRESLREIIKFSPGPKCRTNDWYDCFEQVVIRECECCFADFECSKRVWGDEYEYSQLFVQDRKGNYSRLIPNYEHTDGYEIFGMNYLTLLCKLISDSPSEEIKNNIEQAKSEMYKSENLRQKYVPYFHTVNTALRKRLGDNPTGNNLFYQIGCASLLIGFVNVVELQELLPFWRYAIQAYADLVYRDLIVSELYQLFWKKEGEIVICQ